MNRRVAGLLVLGGALLLVLGWWQLMKEPRNALKEPATAPTVAATPIAPQAPEAREVWTARLALLGERQLEPQEVELESGVGTEAHLHAVLERLLAAGEGAPFRGQVRTRDLLLAPGGTAYVDLTSADGALPKGLGSLEELLSVYAVVHTVLDNAPEVERVVLLWNGKQPLALAGHVDLSRPLTRMEDLEPR